MTVHLETSSSTTATRKGAADSWSKVSTQEMVGRGLGPLTEERKPQHASPADPSELGGQWSDWRREKQCGAGVSARFGGKGRKELNIQVVLAGTQGAPPRMRSSRLTRARPAPGGRARAAPRG